MVTKEQRDRDGDHVQNFYSPGIFFVLLFEIDDDSIDIKRSLLLKLTDPL